MFSESSGVYKITSPSGKVYIGSAKNLKKRIRRYKALDCKNQPRLYNSLIKYGVDNHVFEVVCTCEYADVFKLEKFYGIKYSVLGDNGLNCSLPKGDESEYTYRDSVIEKIRKRHIGRKLSEESKRKIGDANKNMSERTKEILRKINTGKKHTEEAKAKMSIKKIGKPALNRKVVLDLMTGVFYYSILEASFYSGIPETTLRRKIKTNKINLIYA
jgi:group I intron endonuclease